MAPTTRTLPRFDQVRQQQSWTRVAALEGVDAARSYAAGANWLRAPTVQPRLTACLDEAQAMARAALSNPVTLAFDRQGPQGYLSLINPRASIATTWDFDIPAVDALTCLQQMAQIATRGKPGCTLTLLPQQNRAYQWRATLIHPMQARETDYRRLVREAGRAPDVTDPREAQSKALAHFCQQSDAQPEAMDWHPQPATHPAIASVGMNHLIDSFYLFRLLVRYEVGSDQPIVEDLRAELSGDLTKLLHNGDPRRAGWLRNWLIAKMADLGARIDRLNGSGARNVIFFLKGGRALYYFLDRPELGQNDWDAQVVINPNLPAVEWYGLLAKVHDELLNALQQYQVEFATLFAENADLFADYLREEATRPPSQPDPTEERNPNDALDDDTDLATCKAELIDIGIPRRDSAAGLEEWHRLAAPGGIITAADGVRYPSRPYYLNEYLMMTREAFAPGADIRKARKRMMRFGELLAVGGTIALDAGTRTLLPGVAAQIDMAGPGKQELFTIAANQFAAAYSLTRDIDLAPVLDRWLAGAMQAPPPLDAALAAVLRVEDRDLASWIGAIEQVSGQLQNHIRDREVLMREAYGEVNYLIRRLDRRMGDQLREHGAQLAIVGSYAARQHSAQLRLDQSRLDPLRRIVVHVQHPNSPDPLAGLREAVTAILDGYQEARGRSPMLELLDENPDDPPQKRALILRWRDRLGVPDGPSYQPVVLKLRAANFGANRLPVLASIRGMPVLDMRFLAEDYLQKAAKTDENTMRVTISTAYEALVDMMSNYDLGLVGRAFGDSEI